MKTERQIFGLRGQKVVIEGCCNRASKFSPTLKLIPMHPCFGAAKMLSAFRGNANCDNCTVASSMFSLELRNELKGLPSKQVLHKT